MEVAAQAGNPYALAVVQGRLAEAAKMLGLNAVAGQLEHQLQLPSVDWETHVYAEPQQPTTTDGGVFENQARAQDPQPPTQGAQVSNARPHSNTELEAEYIREFEAQKEVERRLGVDSLFV